MSWGRGQCERGVPSEPTEKGHLRGSEAGKEGRANGK